MDITSVLLTHNPKFKDIFWAFLMKKETNIFKI